MDRSLPRAPGKERQMRFEVSYHYATGQLQKGFEPDVGYDFISQLRGRECPNTYAVAHNIDGEDGYTICIDPEGELVGYESLPWVVAECKAEQDAVQKHAAEVLRRGYVMLSEHDVHVEDVDVLDNTARVRICGASKWLSILKIEAVAARDDTHNDLVAWYRALLDAIKQHPKCVAKPYRARANR
jgi:hypothetical protein